MLHLLRQVVVCRRTLRSSSGALLGPPTPVVVLKTLCMPVTESIGKLNLDLMVPMVDRLELPAPLTWLVESMRFMILIPVLVPSPGTILCMVALVATMLLMSSIPTLLASGALIT